jgi:hypothetical protein
MATPAQVAANQANSQKSTGPTSPAGKARSSRNSFKHGLYSKDLVLPNEDPAELDQLRASLRAEHQPINTTEDMLVNDLAENFWRLRRMREFETRAMQAENIVDWHQTGLLAVVQRTMGSAERGFHKSLTALRRLQKDRGFVPQESQQPNVPISDSAEIGSVPQDFQGRSEQIGFVPELSEVAARELAALREEMRPFRDESGSISRENFHAFSQHIKEKCMAQLKDLPEAA